MTAQYWVGDFSIDLTRNQITQKTQSQTIAPKALAVLTHLAKNVNTVVSHDELLNEIWPDSVVTPNTLQRSIAQLRKALGDDGHFQSYIKTHAKQGYSLEVAVRWQGSIDAESMIGQAPLSKEETSNSIAKGSASDVPQTYNVTQPHNVGANKTKSPSVIFKLISVFVGILIVCFIGVKFLSPTQTFKLSFGELRSLTATDNKELAAIYTPDGEYIIFQRYSDASCSNNIWAKNTNTQQESQLLKELGTYGRHSISEDGKKLVFIETQNCKQPITQKKCYNLMSLDFERALLAPQSPSLLMECKNSRITQPMWLSNNNVALFQVVSNRRQLINYSLAENKSSTIYELEDGNLIDFDYSAKDDLIALTSVHNDGQHYIEILKPDGQVLSSYKIEYPKEITNLRNIYPNFMPGNDLLIFSTGRQLFTLSYEGKVTNISLPLDEPMGSPVFHPDGNRMLMIKGHYDSDIATIPRSQIALSATDQTKSTINSNYSIIERSILGEDHAIFQPRGELIAFQSGRSGEDQVWISDGNGAQQLTHFPIDTYIYGLTWAADGKSILVNANKELTQVFLDSSQKSLSLPHTVERLFQWDSEDNTALLIARIKGILKLVEFDLKTLEFRVITDEKVNWAFKSEDGRLIYTDSMERFWQPGPAEDQLIDSIRGQGSQKRFLIKDNVIYGVNDEFQLWSYDLKEDTFEILGDIPKNTDDLTDINQTDILLTVRISAKKEVAELILNDDPRY